MLLWRSPEIIRVRIYKVLHIFQEVISPQANLKGAWGLQAPFKLVKWGKVKVSNLTLRQKPLHFTLALAQSDIRRFKIREWLDLFQKLGLLRIQCTNQSQVIYRTRFLKIYNRTKFLWEGSLPEVCHFCTVTGGETTFTSHSGIQGLFLSFVSILPVRVPWMTVSTKSNSFRSLSSLPILPRLTITNNFLYWSVVCKMYAIQHFQIQLRGMPKPKLFWNTDSDTPLVVPSETNLPMCLKCGWRLIPTSEVGVY